jgi:hypothetical protein
VRRWADAVAQAGNGAPAEDVAIWMHSWKSGTSSSQSSRFGGSSITSSPAATGAFTSK